MRFRPSCPAQGDPATARARADRPEGTSEPSEPQGIFHLAASTSSGGWIFRADGLIGQDDRHPRPGPAAVIGRHRPGRATGRHRAKSSRSAASNRRYFTAKAPTVPPKSPARILCAGAFSTPSAALITCCSCWTAADRRRRQAHSDPNHYRLHGGVPYHARGRDPRLASCTRTASRNIALSIVFVAADNHRRLARACGPDLARALGGRLELFGPLHDVIIRGRSARGRSARRRLYLSHLSPLT